MSFQFFWLLDSSWRERYSSACPRAAQSSISFLWCCKSREPTLPPWKAARHQRAYPINPSALYPHLPIWHLDTVDYQDKLEQYSVYCALEKNTKGTFQENHSGGSGIKLLLEDLNCPPLCRSVHLNPCLAYAWVLVDKRQYHCRTILSWKRLGWFKGLAMKNLGCVHAKLANSTPDRLNSWSAACVVLC